MALPGAPGSPVAPQSLPTVGQGGAPGAAPPGPPGGATMPTPNRGLQANGLALISAAVKVLLRALQVLGPETEPGKDALKAVTALSKHIPPGSTSPGIENNSFQQLQQQQRQDAPMLNVMRAQSGGAAPQPKAA